MSLEKLKHDYESLKTEYQVCKRKLDSKCEALQILTKDLDQSRQQRDQFKLMAEQVQQRYQAIKRQLAGVDPKRGLPEEKNELASMKSQSLAQMLTEMREYSKTLQFERDDFAQKLADAQGDIKLLREQIARQRVGTSDEGMTTRHFPAHERQDLVRQLEASREQMAQLERDIQQVLDEKEDQETERDVYKTKYENLNKELNYILKGDEKRVVDIDALITEKKYLQERLSQMEEEKGIAQATALKYKSILDKRKQKGILKLGQSRNSGLVISQKQVSELLQGRMAQTPQMMADLQAVASALLDTVNDKNLALSHQRKTNRILGNRVSELEKKVRTLELSGLCTTPGHVAGLDKLKLECEEIKSLLPGRLGGEQAESDDKASTTEGESKDTSPMSSAGTTPRHEPGNQANSLLLQDLDLLPTKDNSKDVTQQQDDTALGRRNILQASAQLRHDASDSPACFISGNLLDNAQTPCDASYDGLDSTKYGGKDSSKLDDLAQGEEAFDLDFESLPTEEYEHFMEDVTSQGLKDSGNLDSEFPDTSSQLHDLMETMTLKVTEKSRFEAQGDEAGREVDYDSHECKPVNTQESTDRSPLLQDREKGSRPATDGAHVGV